MGRRAGRPMGDPAALRIALGLVCLGIITSFLVPLRASALPPVALDWKASQADPKGKIQKTCVTKLADAIGKRCTGIDLVRAFPGCQTSDPGELQVCLDRMVECQVCRALNEADNLDRNCDLFDDSLANGSCSQI